MNLARHLATESENDAAAAEIEALAKAQPYLEEWIGYDLDKTLFVHEIWKGVLHFGEPIPAMIEHLKHNLEQGIKCKIFTARVSYDSELINAVVGKAIQDLLFEHVGQRLEVTCKKDMGMRKLFDDRAFNVEPNKGIINGATNHGPSITAEFTRRLKEELGQD
jgi:hypothetical protein